MQSAQKPKLRKGLWSPEEDEKLVRYITKFGHKCWSIVPKHAGLQRCGKSCRLRWINYLRPDLKRGHFTQEEEDLIVKLHAMLGNRWAQIATQLPGRTDNEIKNFWNSCLRKKLRQIGIDPHTHKPLHFAHSSSIVCSSDNSGEVITPDDSSARLDDQSSTLRFRQQCNDNGGSFTLSMLPITLSPPRQSRAAPLASATHTSASEQHQHQTLRTWQALEASPVPTPESLMFQFWMGNAATSSSNSSISNTIDNSSSPCSESDSWSFSDGIFSPSGTGTAPWALLDSSLLDIKIDVASWPQQSGKSLAQFYDDEPTLAAVLGQM